MNITKVNHSCLILEQNGESLVIDPGNFSTEFVSPDNVAAIVLTHEHADHMDMAHVTAILEKNPGAVVIGPSVLSSTLAAVPLRTVAAGSTETAGAFELSFFGEKHALIHDSIPVVDNVGVLVNKMFYYPGDAFTVPDATVDTLALPAAGPWMSIGEAMDYLVAVRPRLAFPAHDAVASKEGKMISDTLLGRFADAHGITYRRLDGTIEI